MKKKNKIVIKNMFYHLLFMHSNEKRILFQSNTFHYMILPILYASRVQNVGI